MYAEKREDLYTGLFFLQRTTPPRALLDMFSVLEDVVHFDGTL